MPNTLAGILRSRADSPLVDRTAIRFKEGESWVEWNWGRYWETARQVAAGLYAAGVRPGDHILMVVPEVQTAVSSLFGAWALGAVPCQVGLPFQLTDPVPFLERLAATANRLDARALVLSASLAEFTSVRKQEFGNEFRPRTLVAESLLGCTSTSALPDPEDAPGPAFIQLTSGSTGHPRGVVVPQDRLLLHMASMSEALRSHSDSVGVSWLPLHHDMGLLGGLLFPFYNGFPAHMISTADFRKRPWCWLEAMSRFRGTICAAPPSAYAICVQLAPRLVKAGLDLGAWECAMVGAEPIAAGVLRRFAAAFAPCGFRADAFFPVYGLAEATVAVTFPTLLAPTHFDRVDRRLLESEGRALPGSDGADALEFVGVGRPIPHTEMQIISDASQALPDRVVGEILVRSSTMMAGYYGEPEATRDAIRGGWLRTGDLGYRAEGSLFVTGRAKDLIIKGGQNLVPSALEEITAHVEGVRLGGVAAVGVRCSRHETEMVYVVAETRLEPGSYPHLEERIREALKGYGVAVDRVLPVPPRSLPKTTSGKLKRRALVRALEAGVCPNPSTEWDDIK
jgi:fatty-acyl-CoA synthase